MSPQYVLAAVICSCTFAICGLCLSFYIVYRLLTSENQTKQTYKNEYQSKFKILSIIAVISFTFCNIFVFAYAVWIFIDYTDELEDKFQAEFEGWTINVINVFFLSCGKILVLLICNSRLYYTFHNIPGLRISNTFYYTMNILSIVLLPAFLVFAFIDIYATIPYLIRIGFDGWRLSFIVIISCVAFMFNKRLYKKTMDRRTVRNFKLKRLQPAKTMEKEEKENENENEEAIRAEFMRAATGRDDMSYNSMGKHGQGAKASNDEVNEFDDSVYVLLDIITRYSLVLLMNVSMCIDIAIHNIRFYAVDPARNPVSFMLNSVYGSFDAVLNSFCLLLFYFYGDKYYLALCQCNKNKKYKCCAMHYCAEKCCVALAKRCN